MKDYRTGSPSFKEYLLINNIAWDDCEVEILMESIDEKPVRDYEYHLNNEVFNDDEFCWSRNTNAVSKECLQRRYLTLCRLYGVPHNPKITLDEMVFFIGQYISEGEDVMAFIQNKRESYKRERLERERLALAERQRPERERLEREKFERIERQRLERERLERDHRERVFRQEHPELFDWGPSEDFT